MTERGFLQERGLLPSEPNEGVEWLGVQRFQGPVAPISKSQLPQFVTIKARVGNTDFGPLSVLYNKFKSVQSTLTDGAFIRYPNDPTVHFKLVLILEGYSVPGAPTTPTTPQGIVSIGVFDGNVHTSVANWALKELGLGVYEPFLRP